MPIGRETNPEIEPPRHGSGEGGRGGESGNERQRSTRFSEMDNSNRSLCQVHMCGAVLWQPRTYESGSGGGRFQRNVWTSAFSCTQPPQPRHPRSLSPRTLNCSNPQSCSSRRDARIDPVGLLEERQREQRSCSSASSLRHRVPRPPPAPCHRGGSQRCQGPPKILKR